MTIFNLIQYRFTAPPLLGSRSVLVSLTAINMQMLSMAHGWEEWKQGEWWRDQERGNPNCIFISPCCPDRIYNYNEPHTLHDMRPRSPLQRGEVFNDPIPGEKEFGVPLIFTRVLRGPTRATGSFVSRPSAQGLPRTWFRPLLRECQHYHGLSSSSSCCG